MKWFHRFRPERHGEILKVILLFFALTALGAVGYKLFEGTVEPELSWDDAIWWSIVTMTTVGYGDYFSNDRPRSLLGGHSSDVFSVSGSLATCCR